MKRKTKEDLQKEINFLKKELEIKSSTLSTLLFGVFQILETSKRNLFTGKRTFNVDKFTEEIARLSLSKELELYISLKRIKNT